MKIRVTKARERGSKLGEYYCTNCGADLDEQIGFSPWSGCWTCEKCGTLLTNPYDADFDTPSGIVCFCDGCDACLNKQIGFNEYYDEWICEQCGYTNRISEDEVYDNKEDYQIHKAIENCGNVIASMIGATAALVSIGVRENEKREQEIEREKQKRREKRAKIRKRLWSAVAHRKLITINVSEEDCVGKDYTEVAELFDKNGFSKIRVNIIEDLEIEQSQQENIVTKVEIEGNHIFDSGTRVRYDSDICIICHQLKKVFPPLSPKESKNFAGSEIVAMFREAGFANVGENIIYDLTLGWIIKDGKVENVSVGNNEKYKKDIPFRIDTKVVVSYHTFKKNKGKLEN